MKNENARQKTLQDVIDFVDRFGLIILTGLTLVALLAYTFVHTGGLLSEYVDPPWIGYVAAFGIEAAIFTMSIRLGKLLRQFAQKGWGDKETWFSFVWQGSTLVFVLTVSAIANIVEGHKVKHGAELTLTTIQNLDGLQILIGLIATGVIPVVILAMTEIVSGEVKALMGKAQVGLQEMKVAPAQRPALPSVIAGLPVASENMQADLQKEVSDFWGDVEDLQARSASMQAHLQQKPDGISNEAWRAYQLASEGLSQADIANHLGKSVATVSRYLAKVKAKEVAA